MRAGQKITTILFGAALALLGSGARAEWSTVKLYEGGQTSYACSSADASGRVVLHVLRPAGGGDDPKRYLDVRVGFGQRATALTDGEGPIRFRWRVDQGGTRSAEAELGTHGAVFSISIGEFREWNAAELLELEYPMRGEEITAEFDLAGFAEAAGEVLLQSVAGSSRSGPPLAGLDGVSNPELIPASKVEPKYPKRARKERADGSVILQATIGINGRVADVKVQRCNNPGYEFEKAAIEAVRQWRYKPARKDGAPVEVVFIIFVEFKLH